MNTVQLFTDTKCKNKAGGEIKREVVNGVSKDSLCFEPSWDFHPRLDPNVGSVAAW